MGSPEAEACEPSASTPILDPKDPLFAQIERAQYDNLARKFFSKKPPPISVEGYLLRLHRYCPMSTAVYLAAGSYILRLALQDRTVPVTPRTVHRLLIGVLRVAMKALEDLSYPHKRFAGVGGVSEKELAKLEITVCYLLDFDLRVRDEDLSRGASNLVGLRGDDSGIAQLSRSPVGMSLQIPPGRMRGPITDSGVPAGLVERMEALAF